MPSRSPSHSVQFSPHTGSNISNLELKGRISRKDAIKGGSTTSEFDPITYLPYASHPFGMRNVAAPNAVRGWAPGA